MGTIFIHQLACKFSFKNTSDITIDVLNERCNKNSSPKLGEVPKGRRGLYNFNKDFTKKPYAPPLSL